MLFAEVDGTVAVIGAVSLLATAVVGALGGWWLKIKQEDNRIRALEIAAETERLKIAGEHRIKEATVGKKGRKDALDEAWELMGVKDADHAKDRAEVHRLRDENNRLTVREALCEQRFKILAEWASDLVKSLESRGIHVSPLPDLSPGETEGEPEGEQ